MNDLHFPNLTIKGFRGIRELTIPQLGRVNLITGKNNTGKSSVSGSSADNFANERRTFWYS